MCQGIAKIMNKTLTSRLREKIAVNDPLSKKLGYEGLADPLGEFMHKRAGTTHPLEAKQNRLRDERAQAARDVERPGTPGHHLSIAAKKARLG